MPMGRSCFAPASSSTRSTLTARTTSSLFGAISGTPDYVLPPYHIPIPLADNPLMTPGRPSCVKANRVGYFRRDRIGHFRGTMPDDPLEVVVTMFDNLTDDDKFDAWING